MDSEAASIKYNVQEIKTSSSRFHSSELVPAIVKYGIMECSNFLIGII